MREIYENSIDWDENLWRYFSTDRFLDLLDSATLYFAAAAQFQDPFEGSVAVISPEYKVDPRYEPMEGYEKAFYELKRLTKISCWHRANYESDAMWKLYALKRKGVAICTTPKKISESLAPYKIKPEYAEEQLYGGIIKYVDLASIRLKSSMLETFYHKHMAFEWEKEFRLAISLRSAEEFGVSVPEKGIKIKIDPASLISRIILGPDLNEHDKIEIIRKAEDIGISGKVELSTLLYTPKYISQVSELT